jgi:P2 family phage contractile tail tube protein
MIDESVINFALYEDSVEFLGQAQVQLPSITLLSQTISGAGIGGNVETVIQGQVDVMNATINFRTLTKESMRLFEPRRHNLELRVAQQNEDNLNGQINIGTVKHVLVVIPKTYNGGNIAPASPSDGSIETSVRYWATYIDGVKTLEVDPFNFIFFMNGVDYLADVRAALGK